MFYRPKVCLSIVFFVLAAHAPLIKCVDSKEGLQIDNICHISSERYPDNDHPVSEILKTYEVCFETIQTYPEDDKNNLLEQFLNKLECFKEDLKQSYYAGNLKYSEIEQVESSESRFKNKDDKFDQNKRHTELKCEFSRPVRSTIKHVIPLVVTGTLSEKEKACEAIFKQTKAQSNLSETDIPTPQLDNNRNPKELTVPLTTPSTYKVDSPEAEEALTQYYKVVMKCLTLTTEHKIQVFRFNKKFYDWLQQAVLPHLKDDKCYPAFGGVLRIVETMRQNDFVPKNATANFIFYRQKDLGREEEERRRQNEYPGKIFRFSYFPLIIIPFLLFIMLIICFVLWRTGRLWCIDEYDFDKDSSTTEVFYYPIEDSRSVSLMLDESGVETSPRTHSGSATSSRSRQRGGADSPVICGIGHQQQHTLTDLPLKRLKSSSSGYNPLKSPTKRQKKTLAKYSTRK